jgi:hypothetical protein
MSEICIASQGQGGHQSLVPGSLVKSAMQLWSSYLPACRGPQVCQRLDAGYQFILQGVGRLGGLSFATVLRSSRAKLQHRTSRFIVEKFWSLKALHLLLFLDYVAVSSPQVASVRLHLLKGRSGR